MVQPAGTVEAAPDAEAAALIAAGAALDAEAAPAPVDPQTGPPIAPPAPVNYLDEATVLVDLICGAAEAIFADSGLQFSPPTRAKLAAGWSPVMEKYEATGAGIFGEYRAEVGAAIVTVPVVLAARKVIQAGKNKEAAAVPPAPTAGASSQLDFNDADARN